MDGTDGFVGLTVLRDGILSRLGSVPSFLPLEPACGMAVASADGGYASLVSHKSATLAFGYVEAFS